MDRARGRKRELEKKNENQWPGTKSGTKSGTTAESLRNVRDSFYGYYPKAMGRTQNNPPQSRAVRRPARLKPGASQPVRQPACRENRGAFSCCPANSATPSPPRIEDLLCGTDVVVVVQVGQTASMPAQCDLLFASRDSRFSCCLDAGILVVPMPAKHERENCQSMLEGGNDAEAE